MNEELKRKYGYGHSWDDDYDNRETRRKKGRRSGFSIPAKLPKKK